MAQIARRIRVGHDTVPTPDLPRPGRRAFSLSLGLAFPFLLVDAIFHPGPVADLWTMRTVQDFSAAALHQFQAAGENATGSTVVITNWGAAPIRLPAVPWWVIVGMVGVALVGFGLHSYRARPRATGDAGAGGAAQQRPVPSAVRPPPPRPVRLLPRPLGASDPSDAPCRAA
jgi:hypothetical protein